MKHVRLNLPNYGPDKTILAVGPGWMVSHDKHVIQGWVNGVVWTLPRRSDHLFVWKNYLIRVFYRKYYESDTLQVVEIATGRLKFDIALPPAEWRQKVVRRATGVFAYCPYGTTDVYELNVKLGKWKCVAIECTVLQVTNQLVIDKALLWDGQYFVSQDIPWRDLLVKEGYLTPDFCLMIHVLRHTKKPLPYTMRMINNVTGTIYDMIAKSTEELHRGTFNLAQNCAIFWDSETQYTIYNLETLRPLCTETTIEPWDKAIIPSFQKVKYVWQYLDNVVMRRTPAGWVVWIPAEERYWSIAVWQTNFRYLMLWNYRTRHIPLDVIKLLLQAYLV